MRRLPYGVLFCVFVMWAGPAGARASSDPTVDSGNIVTTSADEVLGGVSCYASPGRTSVTGGSGYGNLQHVGSNARLTPRSAMVAFEAFDVSTPELQLRASGKLFSRSGETGVPHMKPSAVPGSQLIIGPAELLYTDAQMPITMDGSFATLKKDATTMYFFETVNDKTFKYSGSLNDPLRTQIWVKNASVLWNMNGFSGQPWLYNIYRIDATHLLGFIHKEGGGGPPFRIGLGYSTDAGDSWLYLGDIVRPQDDSFNPAGVPYLVVGAYFYVYFDEFPAGGSPAKRLSVARAPVADVLAAAASGTVTTWSKYNSGAWTEGGLTGLGSNIIPGVTERYSLSSDAAYSTVLKQYMLTVHTHNDGHLLLYTSTDGVTWGNRTVLDTSGNGFIQAYSTFVDLSGGATDDSREVGGDFYIIYPRKDWPSNYNYDDLYRRRVTVR